MPSIRQLLLVYLFFIILPVGYTTAEEWADLYEKDPKLFGSEKEEKYDVNALFWEKASWKGHYFNQVFWLYKHTDYPRYKSTRLFPFYNSLESKLDKREKFQLLNYYSRTGLNDSNRTFFPFYFAGEDDTDKKSYRHFFPLYYTFKTDRDDIQSQTSIFLPIYYTDKEIVKDKNQSTERSESFSILHYYYNRTGMVNNKPVEQYQYHFPLVPIIFMKEKKASEIYTHFIPFFYFNWSASQSSTTQLLLFNWKNNEEKGITRFLFLPLFYWEEDSYLHFIPFFLHFRDSVKKETTTAGLFYYFHKSEKKYTSYLLNYFQTGNFQTNEQTKIIFPLYFYNRDFIGNEHRNFLFLWDWTINTSTSTESRIDRFFFLPLVYWKRNSYLHLFPIFFNTEDPDREESYSGGPFFYFSREKESYQNYVINYYRSYDAEKKSEKTIFFPLYFSWKDPLETGMYVPLYYTNKELKTGNSHSNFLGVLDWGKTTGKNGETRLNRFYFIPFLFWKESSYLYVFPFFFRPQSSEAETGIIWSPFYAYSWTKSGRKIWMLLYYDAKDTQKEDFFTAFYPFYISWDNQKSNGLLIPFYYTSEEKETGNRRTNLLGIFDWTKSYDENLDRRLERFFVMPFVYWKRNSYLHVFPFYFRPQPYEEEEGTAFGLFHYHSWNKTTTHNWLLLYYGYENTNSEKRFTTLFPIYYSWKFTESSGNIFLPFHIYYEEGDKSLHLNFTGVSMSTTKGALDASLNAGVNQGKFYIDTELSWFYNLFSISWRKTIDIPYPDVVKDTLKKKMTEDKKELQEVGKEKESPKKETVALKKERSISRENSLNYFGYSVLFGWMQYERADSKRHFRFLPLMWLTWDQESDENITVLPLYFHYKSEELSYRVVGPLYASQYKGNSFIQSFLLIALIREYVEEKNRKEYSILWPFVNFFWSDEGGGSRFLPFYIYRRKAVEEKETSEIISPFFYTASEKEKSGKNSYQFFAPAFLPLVYYSKSIQPSKPDSETVTSGIKMERYFHILPILYFSSYKSDSELGTESATKAGPIFYYAKEKNKDIERSLFVSPLYIFMNETQSSIDSGVSTKVFPIPLLFIKTAKDSFHLNWIFLFNLSWNKEGNTAFLLPFYYYSKELNPETGLDDSYVFTPFYMSSFSSSNRDGKSLRTDKWTYLLLYYGTETTYDFGNIQYENFWILPFFAGHKADMRSGSVESGFHLYPFLFSNKKISSLGVEESSSLFMPLFLLYKKTTQDSFLLDVLWPLISVGVNKTESYNYFFPLYKYTFEAKDIKYQSNRVEQTGRIEKVSSMSVLHYYKDEIISKHSTVKDWLIMFPILPLAYFNTESNDDSKYLYSKKKFFILPLFVYDSKVGLTEVYNSKEKKREKGEYSNWCLWTPLFYVSADKNPHAVFKESNTVYFPFIPLFYRSKEGQTVHYNLFWIFDWKFYEGRDTSRYFLAGLYLYNSPEYTRQNFLYLYDRQYYPKTDRMKLQAFFGTIGFERDEYRKKMYVLWGILFGGEWSDNKTDVNLLWFRYLNEKDHFQLNFFPLYYYDNDPQGTFWMVPPLLSGYSDSTSHTYEMVLLGMGWYRHVNKMTGEESRYVLGGSVYYDIRKRERGYREIGSLWGFLWEYQAEKETDYRKFSLFKFLYNYTIYNRESWHRLFGIRFGSKEVGKEE